MHRRVPRPVDRVLAGVAAALAAATVLGLVVLRPEGGVREDLLGRVGFVRETYDARVLTVGQRPCPGAQGGHAVRCERMVLRLLEGPDRDRRITLVAPASTNRPKAGPGDTVVLGRQPDAQPGFEYLLVDRQRRPVLLALALLFAVAVVFLGRLRGLAALAGLVATFLVLLRFVLPAILDGKSPILVATVGASAIAFLALYLAHGLRPMTTVALIGTLASLALTAVLGTAFVDLAGFTGFATEEAGFLNLGGARIDMAGLVLAGVVLGALGALDDMTVTQASAVSELRSADPGMPARELRRAGLRIGRDHVASTVNTLVLAYAGASLPLFLLFVLSRQSFGTIANSEVVATEIVRTLVGSIGLVVAVPLTTWLAAYANPPQEGARPAPGDEEAHGAGDASSPDAVAARADHAEAPGASRVAGLAPPDDLWLPDRRREAWRPRHRRRRP